MESKTTRLTPLLHELEALMDSVGAPFSSRALPGLADKEIDRLLEPTGLVIPTELREWWRWHHGFVFDKRAPIDREIGPGAWGQMTIPGAIQDAALWCEDAIAVGDEPGWRRSWLPFAEGSPHHRRLVARLEESTVDEVCVGHWYVFDVPPADPVEHSLASVVETWITAVREGYTTWDGSAWVDGGYRWGFPAYAQL